MDTKRKLSQDYSQEAGENSPSSNKEDKNEESPKKDQKMDKNESGSNVLNMILGGGPGSKNPKAMSLVAKRVTFYLCL